MRKAPCADCGARREPERPVARLVDGTVTVVCRRCWRDLGYLGYAYIPATGPAEAVTPFMLVEMSDADRAAMARYR